MTEATDKRTIIIPVQGGDDEAPEVQQAQAENSPSVDMLTDQLQRLQAEFVNYKKRVERDWQSVYARSKGELATKLLPVLDDFDRLLVHHAADATVDRAGVDLIVQKLVKALTDEGLELVPAVGHPFDPELHQAVAMAPVDEDQDGTIVEEWQKGYRFAERLLRPSQVKVGRFEAN